MSRSALWRFLAVALPVLGALVAPLPSVDLAYQLRAGAEILDARAIPSVDTWTFTIGGAPWLDQQWGAQVLLEAVFRIGGWTGLALLRAGLVGLALGLLLVVVRRRAPGLGPIAATLLVIAAFLVSATALALRPQLFAIDLFAAVLLLLAIRDDHTRAIWLIPILAVAWANVHGTFLLGPAMCGLAWIADLVDLPPARGAARHRMLLVGLVATVATVVTPFGPAVWGYVANLASNPTIAGRVSEWQPPSPLTAAGAVLWLSILAVAGLAVARVRATVRATGRFVGAVPWPAVLTLLLFGGFAAVSGRGTAWWPFAAAFVIAPWLARRAAGEPAAATSTSSAGQPEPPRMRRLNAGLGAILVLAGIALLPLWRPSGPAEAPVGVVSYAPQDLAAALNGLAAPGSVRPSVWNPQVWGSWLEFAAPGFRYALDSRIELFPAAVWADADALASGDLSVLDRYRVDIVVTDREIDGRLEAALGQHLDAWTRLMGSDGAVWLRRSAFPNVNPGPAQGPIFVDAARLTG